MFHELQKILEELSKLLCNECSSLPKLELWLLIGNSSGGAVWPNGSQRYCQQCVQAFEQIPELKQFQRYLYKGDNDDDNQRPASMETNDEPNLKFNEKERNVDLHLDEVKCFTRQNVVSSWHSTDDHSNRRNTQCTKNETNNIPILNCNPLPCKRRLNRPGSIEIRKIVGTNRISPITLPSCQKSQKLNSSGWRSLKRPKLTVISNAVLNSETQTAPPAISKAPNRTPFPKKRNFIPSQELPAKTKLNLTSPELITIDSSEESEDDRSTQDPNSYKSPEGRIGTKGYGDLTMNLIQNFDKIPRRTSESPNFAYKPDRVIRKRSERAQLVGMDCDLCRQYYEAISSQLNEEELKIIKNKCSRHRSKYPVHITATPPDYWDPDFPSTEECIERGYM